MAPDTSLITGDWMTCVVPSGRRTVSGTPSRRGRFSWKRGLSILQEFIDVETAKQAGRGGFAEMVAFLKANPSCRILLAEKTDRLYRNFRDYVTLEDLGVEIHFIKENTIIPPESRSADKLMHNIRVAMAKNYTDNLSEEVGRGCARKRSRATGLRSRPSGTSTISRATELSRIPFARR